MRQSIPPTVLRILSVLVLLAISAPLASRPDAAPTAHAYNWDYAWGATPITFRNSNLRAAWYSVVQATAPQWASQSGGSFSFAENSSSGNFWSEGPLGDPSHLAETSWRPAHTL